ncbi:J domain-containing protein [Rhizobium sp. NLR22b]|uniref:J domain-containing protein n=1 Tax=Rhizobium sp. NLR22b TaxID=2731115 RepID=UPI002180B414|nr:J domain-containing protein [Rhizobium sp. NLR22b]
MARYTRAREAGQFRTTLAGAINNVKDSLKRFAADSGKPLSSVVISSNVTLGAEKPSDPGVAVWFVWDGMTVCIPVDRYAKVEANLQAIHHIIEARRTELRHGTLALVRATFTSFAALPAPGAASKRTWRDILGFDPGKVTREQVDAAYRQASKKAHPDAPSGSHDAMAELNRAREEALREIGQ